MARIRNNKTVARSEAQKHGVLFVVCTRGWGDKYVFRGYILAFVITGNLNLIGTLVNAFRFGSYDSQHN